MLLNLPTKIIEPKAINKLNLNFSIFVFVFQKLNIRNVVIHSLYCYLNFLNVFLKILFITIMFPSLNIKRNNLKFYFSKLIFFRYVFPIDF